MNNKFFNALENEANLKETENGATALKSTKSDLLDLFAVIGASRNNSDIEETFDKAFLCDPLNTLKTLFYARDCRGGLGEREVFRRLIKRLAVMHPEIVKLNLELIPELGRWDDLYTFVGTPVEDAAFELMKNQYEKDLLSMLTGLGKPSILAKWLKSVKTSSVEASKLGKLTAKKFGKSEKSYRKTLSALRKQIDVVEKRMSANQWSEIKFENVPSYAAHNYAEAFLNHEEKRYTEYLNAVSEGKKEIKAATLYPYDIVRGYDYAKLNQTKELQWKALPNYVSENKNFLIMADVSGSMIGTPMDISVSLAIYFAERNKGAFANKFLTFTDIPRLISLDPSKPLIDRIAVVERHVGYSTDLEKAFKLVLDSAIKGKLSQEDMPEAIVIISDMEIDEFGGDTTFTSEMKKRFEEAGYKMPTLVYWNVNARQNTFHAEASDNVRFVSGASASVFEGLCKNIQLSAEDLMMDILNRERYSKVRIN